MLLAQLNLLGSIGFGYWSSAPFIGESDRALKASCLVNGTLAQETRKRYRARPAAMAYYPGYMLMESCHPTDKIGWHGLPDEQIPWHNFSEIEAEDMPPCLPPGQILNNWTEWYAWRGLTPESPVALIMYRVLSLYFMLTDALDIRPLRSGERRSLIIHLIGVENELNSVPLLAELALLLPGYDIHFTLFGQSVHKVIRESSKYPDSLAAKKGPIFEYVAPALLGGGSVSVTLWRRGRIWRQEVVLWDKDPIVKNINNEGYKAPDIIMALDPGIGAYTNEYYHVLQACCYAGIPFLSTEVTEYSIEKSTIPVVNKVWDEAFKHLTKSEYPTKFPNMLGKYLWARMQVTNSLPEDRRWRMKFNPFQRPGQRQIAQTRIPNVRAGFVLYVQAYKGLKLLNESDRDPFFQKVFT